VLTKNQYGVPGLSLKQRIKQKKGDKLNTIYEPFKDEFKNAAFVSIQSIKESLIKNVFLIIITLSIYYSYWYLKKRNNLNRVCPEVRLSSFTPVIVIVFIFFNILLWFLDGFISECVEITGACRSFSGKINYLSFYAELCLAMGQAGLVWESFKVRRILLKITNNSQKISKIFTLILGVPYLQYKINKIKLSK